MDILLSIALVLLLGFLVTVQAWSMKHNREVEVRMKEAENRRIELLRNSKE